MNIRKIASVFSVSFALLSGGSPLFSEVIPAAKIAIVGGTYLNDALLESGILTQSFRVETPIGEMPLIRYGEIEGVPFYY